MRKYLEYAWPVIGLAAVVFSFWLLYRELKIISASAVLDAILAIPVRHWIGAVVATIVAYGALAWYDRIALLHLGRKLPWGVISLVSFTTYALSHNIGASVLSGAMVRLRAYGTMGLSIAEVGVLVALCSFTFALGTIILGGLVLVLQPEIVQRLFEIPTWTAFVAGAGMLIFVALYLLGSYLELDPLRIGNFAIYYPRLPIALRQLIAAPLELMGAAGIIYFALPEAGNPGFFVVLGIFLASFSAALISHAPGGLGVLEFVFLKAIGDQIPQADVLAALIVFRLLYLLIPLAFGVVVVILFERSRLSQTLRQRVAGKAAPGAGE
jgi:uncharacterized membrane protein YbhN (UPF0104 family)